jgi:hypothetical protein
LEAVRNHCELCDEREDSGPGHGLGHSTPPFRCHSSRRRPGQWRSPRSFRRSCGRSGLGCSARHPWLPRPVRRRRPDPQERRVQRRRRRGAGYAGVPPYQQTRDSSSAADGRP